MNTAKPLEEQARQRAIFDRLLSGGSIRSSVMSSLPSSLQQPSRLFQPSPFIHAHSATSPVSAGLSISLLSEENNAHMNSSTKVRNEGSGDNMNSHTNDGNAGQDSQQNIQSLLAVPSVDIPPHRRVQSPAQLKFPLYEYQKVCLTWLIQQEQDEGKMGSILAGEPHLTMGST